MSTATTEQVDRRDAEGRHWTAPAWTGDLALLDANELSKRSDYVGHHIASLTAKVTSWLAAPEERFAVSVNVSEITRWAEVRVACLNELERRADEAGVSPVDLVLSAPSWELQ